MITTLANNIETAMKAEGYVLTDSEEVLQDRRYRIVVGDLSTANMVRGGMHSGIVRVDRTIEIRVQYMSDQKSNRRQVAIAEGQEEVVLALNAIATQAGRFDSATVEEAAGGVISIIRFVFPGQVQ